MINVNQEFANYDPCIYKGEIPCRSCKTYKECDMRQGRELHEKCFVDGWKIAISFMASEYVKSITRNCEIHEFSSRVCTLGTKGCVLNHEI